MRCPAPQVAVTSCGDVPSRGTWTNVRIERVFGPACFVSIERSCVGARRTAYWQASHDSGFSSEHATASRSAASLSFAFVWRMRVAGRERR